MLQRPKNLIDIEKKSGEAHLKLPNIVNLSGAKVSSYSIRPTFVKIITVIGIVYFLFSSLFVKSLSLFAPTSNEIFAAETDKEREELESQLKELESQIAEYESTISRYQKQGTSLKSEITRLNTNIAKINLQIKAAKLTISQLDSGIKKTQSDINLTEVEIAEHKGAITGLIRSIYESETASMIEILLSNPKLSDFFGNINDTILVGDKLRDELNRVVSLKEVLMDKKEALAIQRNDTETLRAFQASQQLAIQSSKSAKDQLLQITKGQESKYKDLLTTTKKTAAEIRSRIFQLFGGGQLTFEKALDFAKYAENATGVRSAFILAILNRESALGQNVGRCSPETSMHPTRDLPIFKNIIAELKKAGKSPPEPILVSCANSDGAYGGAMGPAQFIPSTWNLYKEKIASVTGSTPANPWSNADAFVAASLYLKDAGAASNEKLAAARYYCGYKIRAVCTNVYAARVMETARQFQDDIDLLSGQ